MTAVVILFAFTSPTLFSQEKSTEESVIVREQAIYIPYETLRNTFEKNGRGVFLPYEEFRKLWDAAQAKPADAQPPQPVPVPFMISETVHEARVADDIVQVTATLNIDLLKEGWHEIPIRLNNVAITEATIDPEPGQAVGFAPAQTPSDVGLESSASGTSNQRQRHPARLQGNPQTGYKLLLEAAKPGPVNVQLKYARTIEKSPGRNSVSFEVPQSPISRWAVLIPESGVKVDFSPLIAATEEPDGNAGTKVLAFVGAAPTVRIGWTPKAEGATGLESLTSVVIEQRVTLDEGVIRTQGILDYTISRAQVERLAIEVPSDQKVLSVFDPNVRTWSVSHGDDTQTIQVELFQPATDRQRLIIGLEKLFEAGGGGGDTSSVEIPAIRAVGAGRQQGVLGIAVSNTLTTDTSKVSGLMQMDTSELPQGMQGTNWLYAYRLASASYSLALSVEKVQPQVSADSWVVATLNADRLALTMQTIFTIERAGVFQLVLDIPGDVEIGNVTCTPHADARPVSVNTWHTSDLQANEGEPAMKRLTIDLAAKAMGKVGLTVTLTKRLDDANLKSPTGNAVDFKIAMPVVAKDFVIRRDARAIFRVEDYFRITKTDTSNMQLLPVENLRAEWLGNLPNGQLGFLFGQTHASLDLQVERRKPQITIRQFQLVQIEEGVAKYMSRFYYTILHSGIKSLRVDVPAEVSSRLRNRTQGIRDAVMTTQPGDVEEGTVAWEFSGGRELSGTGVFELYWEDALGQLQTGVSRPVNVPRLVPREVDRAYGHIAISKVQTIDLGDSPDNSGLRPIDPRRDIPETDRIENAAAAFEFVGQWTLNLMATRYELEEVKRTSIECGLVRAVMVNNARTLSVQALYQVKSVQQRLTIAMPRGATFDLAPTINGNTVTLEKDSSDTGDTAVYFVPLSSTDPEKSFLVELRYSQPLSGGQILLPTFPAEPAVQEMYVAVYVPSDRALKSFKGMWMPLFRTSADWSFMKFQRMSVWNDPSIENLMGQMMQATGTAASSNRPFATGGGGGGGQAYLFSTLQPGTDKEAVLKVATIKQSVFYGTALGVFVLFAVALTRLRWHGRLAGIAFGAVCVLALGIVNPTLVAMLGSFDSGFPAELGYAAMLMMLIWIVMSCIDCAKAWKCKFAKRETSGQSVEQTNEQQTEPQS